MKKITDTMKEKNNNPSQPQSKFKRIDKYYWLNKGYEMVDGGLERVHKRITDVTAYINGLLAIYVLATVIDAIYLEIDTPLKLVIVLAPVLIVKIASFYGNISVIPEAKSFFPDSAQSSEATYYQFLRDARTHLKKMKQFAAWSTGILLIVLGLVTWWTVKSKKEVNIEKNELIQAKKELLSVKALLDSIIKTDIFSLNTKLLEDENKVLFEGNFPKNNHITLAILNEKNDTLIGSEEFLIGPSGKFYHTLLINQNLQQAKAVKIKLKYLLTESENREISKLIHLKQDN